MLLILLLAGLLVPFEVWAQLQVQPARNTMGVNESLRVEIILDDGDPDSLDLTPLESDFEIVGRARGSQVNIINGSMNKINTWSLRLVPRQSGTLTLPELCADSSCSEPVAIEVSETPSTPDDAKVILEHGSLPERVYVGQQILYPVRLLFRTSVQQAALDTPEPTGVDAEVIKLGEDRQRETYRGGWRYDVIERVYAIIPSQSGTLQIPPVSMEAQIEDTQGSGRRGMQGSFFDPFGSRGQLVRQRTSAAQIEVEPAERSEHHWLPAQELELRDSWEEDPPQLRVGEPATRTITLRAQGTSAEQLPDISLEVPSAFKIYPDQPERENLQNGDSGISAQLRQSAAIVPREAGTFTLSGITLHWWDLRAQRWSTARIEPMEVEVLPAERTEQGQAPAAKTPAMPQKSESSAPAAPDAASDAEKSTRADESLSPEVAPPALTPTPSSAQGSLWVWIAALFALGWLVTLILWWRMRTRLKRLQGSETHTSTTGSGAKDRDGIEHALVKVAQQHDARATRHLLQEWAAMQYPASPTPLDTLYHEGGTQIQEALQQLNAALYSDSAESWNGEQLAEAIRAVSHTVKQGKSTKRNSKKEDLPPLYPEL
ncbi:MAG: BatD family protein [Thermodesulfobacteriota bacterium]